jgi:Na+/proline symporter
MRRVIAGVFERLAAVESRFLAMAFFGALVVYTLALVTQAVGYSDAARLFPLIVGVPLVVMLVVNLLLLAVGDRVDLQLVGFFDAVGDIDAVSAESAVDEAERYRREFSMVVWVGALIGLTWLIGNLAAVAVFVATFVYVHERDLRRALLVSGFTFGFIYLLFVVILDANLYRGVVPLGGLLP